MDATHDELRTLLGRIRRRWFALAALTTVARAAAAAAVPLLAAAVVAWTVAPAGWRLVAVMALGIGASLAAVALVVSRMPRRPDDCQVARFVEERTGAGDVAPALCDQLVSAVHVIEAPDRQAGGLAALLVARAVGVLRGLDPAVLIPPESIRRAAIQACGGAAILIASLVVGFPPMLRAGATVWIAWFPQTIRIDVSTGSARVPAGRPLRIAATIHGRGAHLLSLSPSLVVSANRQQRAVPMTGSPDGFSYTIQSVDRSFEYRVVAGASSSPAFAVTALFPPKVTSIDVSYDYPTFTGLKPRDEKNGGDIYAPEGTRIQLLVHADKALAGGELAMSGGPAVPMRAAGNSASAELVLAEDGGYRVRLSDRDGLGSVGEVEYFIRVMDDRPPTVQIVRPTQDQGVTPLQEVAIEARADDDYGIAQLDLVFAVAGRAAKTVPFTRLSGTDVARIGSHLLAVENLGVQPGDVITYYARARDVARGKRSTETRSDMFFLEVKPFSEEFVAAQSQAMGGGGSSATQIDALIAAQKEIINATWNLERRSTAGRSADDLKAVAGAQAELKSRTEQMAGGARRGNRGFFPQQIAQPRPGGRAASGDPVAAAVAAMAKALEQLQESKTADAIPHQMSALQGLLQAQAEVRRRQVMQQSASAAGQGGTSRTDRDLSALFDQELQRQQRTNYETPPQSADAPRENENDLLERIRDLARRQDELARRQRELAAAGMSDEERKRQLERLSREQEELRQRAEELRKQAQSQAGAAGGRGRGGSPASGGEMQRAAEQMRNAATELQRQNAGGAAASAEAAAEALRRLERQVRGSSADARQRTAGELRLEAQQIADAQRRAAAEAARLAKERTGDRATADALRRLAAEKDKLAERIGQLQQAAREAERDSPGAEGAPLREAGRQLQEQQVGARMRESAQQLRDRASAGSGARQGGTPKSATPAPAPDPAQREQQLTRSLETVANTLAGGADEGRRLAEQLDRTREMRDRLNEAERRVREEEARAAANAGRQPGDARGGGASNGVQRARDDYMRQLQRSRESLGRMRADQQRGDLGGSTPEQHEYSRSAPGNEAFKQDFGGWESLRKDVDLALEQYEAAISERLARKEARERLSGGGSERIPEAYRPMVSRYFEAIAKAKK